MKTFAIVNRKGGVGKTTTAVNLAYVLATSCRLRVLLVDADGQANATQILLPPGEYAGLGALLRGYELCYEELVEHTDVPGLDVLPAAREDRSVIPPVRIGETIYHITTCKNFPQVLDGTMYGPDGGHGTATGYYCPCELQENCPHPLDDEGGFDCDKHKNELAVFEDTVESIFLSQTEEMMNFDYSGSADFCEFGRTVFREYDKAKAALEEIKNGKND